VIVRAVRCLLLRFLLCARMKAETSELRSRVEAQAHRTFKFRIHITTVFFVTRKGSQMKTCFKWETQKCPRSQELVRDDRATQMLHHAKRGRQRLRRRNPEDLKIVKSVRQATFFRT
jgi:hypothetical protein